MQGPLVLHEKYSTLDGLKSAIFNDGVFLTTLYFDSRHRILVSAEDNRSEWRILCALERGVMGWIFPPSRLAN